MTDFVLFRSSPNTVLLELLLTIVSYFQDETQAEYHRTMSLKPIQEVLKVSAEQIKSLPYDHLMGKFY